MSGTSEPTTRVGWHNRAAELGDRGDPAGASAAAERAFALGLDAPETWLVHGRARLGLNDLEGAERSFREALKRRPDYAEAHLDLAQLIWMRDADLEAASAVLEAAIVRRPDPRLASVRALVLERGGALDRAAEAAEDAARRWPEDPLVLGDAARLAAERGDSAQAAALAERAILRAPGSGPVVETLCTAWLALGQAEDVLAVMRGRLQARPFDQSALAFLATAARITGDPAYAALYDYDRFVRPAALDSPEGWASREAWLADLKAELDGLHALRTHPFQNSLRGGSQTTRDLAKVETPAVRGFFRAIRPAMDAYLAAVGTGPDPLRSRNGGRWRVKGAWSVKLRPGGNHVDHLHPEGWLSSAFYVETPARALDGGDRQGWLRFGKPRFPTRPALEAERWVRPEPGTLVLFPSYMWHGTEPFRTDETRMTIAFDVVPA